MVVINVVIKNSVYSSISFENSCLGTKKRFKNIFKIIINSKLINKIDIVYCCV